MVSKFYKKTEEALQVKEGTPTTMFCALRLEKPGRESHFIFGNLIRKGEQLFFPVAPELAAGSFVQARQDTKDDDTVDVTVIGSAETGFTQVKGDWHHQPENKTAFYQRTIDFGGTEAQLFIGSGISWQEFIAKTEEAIEARQTEKAYRPVLVE